MSTPGGSAPPSVGLPLARSVVDRAAHRRGDPAWLAQAWSRARVLVLGDAGRALVRPTGEDTAGRVLVLLASSASPPVPVAGRYFLGVAADQTPLFAVCGPHPALDGAAPASLREVGHLLPAGEADLFATGLALANWHRVHHYSPATGQPTEVVEGGWGRVAPDGRQLWPRTDPAVIVLVHDGVSGPRGRCLLAHSGAWASLGVRRFACLAGFVEAGESAEATVEREIREEAGVRVWDIRYVASQPWPLPASLMLGFTARADPAEPVTVDGREVHDARWFSRREVAAVYAGERVELDPGVRLALPTSASISAFLVTGWLRSAPAAP